MKRPAPGETRKKMAKEGSAAEEAGESRKEAKAEGDEPIMKGARPGKKGKK